MSRGRRDGGERLELHARVGLARLVAGVGVAAVAEGVRLHVGTGRHRLRLALLEAPGRPCPAPRRRASAQLDGDSAGATSATYCSIGTVLTVRASAGRVGDGLQGPVDLDGARWACTG